LKAAQTLRRLLSVYLDNEDLISIGAYRAGSSGEIDNAIQMKPIIDKYLQQPVAEQALLEDSIEQIKKIALGEK